MSNSTATSGVCHIWVLSPESQHLTAVTVVLLKFVDLIFNSKPADDRNVQ